MNGIEIQNQRDRRSDEARRRTEEEVFLSQHRERRIFDGNANPFVLWRQYNLGRYYNLGLRIRDKVYGVYRSKTTRGDRIEFNARMMDGSLIAEAISEIRLDQILAGNADQDILGLQYNLGDLTKVKVYDVYTYLTTPEQRADFHERMMDGSLVGGLRTGANMHTSYMLENNKIRLARADTAAAAVADAADAADAATAPQSAQLTNKLPARPMREILEFATGTPHPRSSGGMIRKTRKHKRRNKRKRNSKHTHRRHSKSSKRKSSRHF